MEPMTAHFELSEEQELRMYRVRHIMQVMRDMADAIPPGKQICMNPESLSCLFSIMEELLPQDKDMLYQIHS
ncbi:hypothetical protein [Methylomicrobium sp. Wu6]|uniref:hypothetical protein n=1 Tax=Methylomicrobium sp. Wu6 TaxID=3107928 RepID=UPI002DD69823|nr:hypothetical protein [Methylomicrobium sp. Wu6]MEC4750015.1 hypothetical protein [Methylomicrobium sp. Wu6]